MLPGPANGAEDAARTAGVTGDEARAGHPASSLEVDPYQPGTLPHPAALVGAPIPWSELGRILVVRPDNLGDVLLLGPALRALRRAAPDARITLLGSPAGSAVAPLLPDLDDVLLVEHPMWQDAGPQGDPDPAGQLAVVDDLRRGAFDAAVVVTSFSQSPHPAALLCLLAGIPIRAAFSREFGGGVLTHWVPSPDRTQHQADRALELLARLGVPVDDVPRELAAVVPPGAVEGARAAAGLSSDDRYVVVLPGASCSSRRYDPDRFGAVTAELAASGRTVVVAGSAREGALVDAVAGTTAGTRRLAGGLDVPGLAGLLADADAVVSNNSGGMHLAAAVGTPPVVLFAGTELVAEYAPRLPGTRVLRRETPCTPCRAFRCPFAHECLDVPPAEVAAAVTAAVLERTAPVVAPRVGAAAGAVAVPGGAG